MNLKLIYGTDTGNTVNIIDNHLLIELEKAGFNVSTLCVNQVQSSDWQNDDKFILGVPTWCDGGLQSCWENYFDTTCHLFIFLISIMRRWSTTLNIYISHSWISNFIDHCPL